MRAALMMAGALGVALAMRERARAASTISLRRRSVFITGGSRGLGLLLAREFGREGARVAICARDGQELERARRRLEADGVVADPIVCDVRDRHAVERTVDEVMRRFGGLDILVNNAGIIQVGPVAALDVQDFEDAMAVNFWGMVYTTLAVLPEMRRRRRGRIVNITSIGGKVSVPHLLPYGASKFAAVGFSEGLRAELAADGVRVITIAPGLMRTGSYLNAWFKGDAGAEARWFGLGATLPGVSMSAERAARQIVRATRRGDTERVLSVPAAALSRVHGLLPALTIEALTLANRLILPRAAAAAGVPVRGAEVEPHLGRWVRALMVLGRSAAQAYGQRPGPAPVERRAGSA
jgi:NAD(P)-dependent dehydrogenase (short-subunit alcohol dehydrogenase family)